MSAIERAIEKYRNEVDGYKSEARSEEAQIAFDTTQEILEELKYILKEEQSKSEWIPVEERLPELHVQVLTRDKMGCVKVLRYQGEGTGGHVFRDGYTWGSHVTSWMSLPEPPAPGEES